jgi:hypothetical protein
MVEVVQVVQVVLEVVLLLSRVESFSTRNAGTRRRRHCSDMGGIPNFLVGSVTAAISAAREPTPPLQTPLPINAATAR